MPAYFEKGKIRIAPQFRTYLGDASACDLAANVFTLIAAPHSCPLNAFDGKSDPTSK
jgi:hypothetical protein